MKTAMQTVQEMALLLNYMGHEKDCMIYILCTANWYSNLSLMHGQT